MNDEAVKELYYRFTGVWVMHNAWEELSEQTRQAWRDHFNRVMGNKPEEST